jgi:hypothetical protein
MARTLAELQDQPVKRRPRPTWPDKTCRFCQQVFAPLSGMAAAKRERCYREACEQANEAERRRRAQEKG